MEVDRRRTRENNQASTSSSTNAKFDIMMKTMESLMDRLELHNRIPSKEYSKPQIRNRNFKRPPPPPQIRHKDQRNPRNVEDQQIRPPFLDNFFDEEEENYPMDNQICHFSNTLELETKQYQRGYQNDINKNLEKSKFEK